MNGLRIGNAGKLGRGVFATKDFEKGMLLESSPILVFDQAESAILERTILGNYCYSYEQYEDCACERVCLAFGYASFYNHSVRPNAVYRIGEDRIFVFALKKIKAGTQIKINYNGDPKDKTPWVFKAQGRERSAR